MPVKFKIGFTIDAETLFGLMAKFLPLEDLTVEEVVEHAERHAAPKRLAHVSGADMPKIKRTRHTLGANGGQLKVLVDHARKYGVVGYGGLGEALKAAGFARAGAGSAIKRALDKGILVRHENGGYMVREKESTA
jgi:hypothetical protein